MKKLTHTLLALGLLAVGGCKVEITAPTNGSVVTSSGSVNCKSGQNCEVMISDIHFDETFKAVPNNGYSFSHWKKRDRGFCGGNKTPCRLFTSGFVGNDTLMGFLERDEEVFYLEPVFTSDGDQPISDDPGSSCVNPTLTMEGTTVKSRYRLSSSSGFTDNDFEQTNSGTEIYNGRQVQRMVIKQTGTYPTVDSTLTYYYSVFNNAQEIRQYGATFSSNAPTVNDGTLTMEPFRVDRWNVSPGQSYSQTYTQTIESTNASSYGDVTKVTTYLGIESLNVYAGSFRACKVVSRFDNGDVETHWYDSDSGILVKSVTNDVTQELVWASINDQVVK